jgi:hypothetical protein
MTELSFRFSMARTKQRARRRTHDEEDNRCHTCGQQIPQSPGSVTTIECEDEIDDDTIECEDEIDDESKEEGDRQVPQEEHKRVDKEDGGQPTKKTKVVVQNNEEDHAARAQFIFEKNVANAKLKILKEEQEVQAANAEVKEAEYEVEACNNKVKQFELDRTIQNLDRKAQRETWSNVKQKIDELSTAKELDNVRLKIFEAQHEVHAAILKVREAELGVQVAKNNLRQIELAKAISDLKLTGKNNTAGTSSSSSSSSSSSTAQHP